MARPTTNIDQKLIKAALKLFPKTGFSNLKVRAVVKQAGVNLGMFHYYFQNKQQFIERILSDMYESFFSQLQLEVASQADPEKRLRHMVKTLVCFVRDHRRLVIPLLNDLMQGQPEVQAFLAKNMQRHMKIVFATIQDCQHAGVIVKLPLPVIVPFIFGSQVAPQVIANIIEHIHFNLPAALLKFLAVPKLINDHAIEQRLDLVMKALKR